MIASDRDVGVMFHVTAETKEMFRLEAARRKVSMSALLSQILEEWLEFAPLEQLEPKRSNKRDVTILPPIPGHRHTIVDGKPTCGCVLKDGQIDVGLPLENE